MNLIEAIRSGKPFRRKVWDNDLGEVSYCFYADYDWLEEEDILADDWETEESKVAITRSQFYAAWRTAVETSKDSSFSFVDLVAKELGL